MMINILHLLWIIPLSVGMGIFMIALMTAASASDKDKHYCGEDSYNYKSCKTCKFSTEPYKDLYKCNNTEINIKSNQREKFYCSKWEKR